MPTKAVKPKAPKPRMSLEQAMAALEEAGTEQTRKTWRRHGAPEPMFGVSFATLKLLLKKVGVDHELACQLWDTGNYDARNLAVKIADPARMSTADLDAWARGSNFMSNYAAMLACESGRGLERATAWLASSEDANRRAGWSLVGAMAMNDETQGDAWFSARLAEIEQQVHGAANMTRYTMNNAVIGIGCRNPALRDAALAATARIGRVDVDHGNTDCKTPDAKASIEKAWAYSASKGFDSPAAQERTREPMRLRC